MRRNSGMTDPWRWPWKLLMAKSLRSQVLKNIDKDPALLKKYKDEFSI